MLHVYQMNGVGCVQMPLNSCKTAATASTSGEGFIATSTSGPKSPSQDPSIPNPEGLVDVCASTCPPTDSLRPSQSNASCPSETAGNTGMFRCEILWVALYTSGFPLNILDPQMSVMSDSPYVRNPLIYSKGSNTVGPVIIEFR